MSVENVSIFTRYPRLKELCDFGKQNKLAHFFEGFERRILENPDEHTLKEYERVLACLDNDSWNELKNRVIQKTNLEELYGYSQIADCLNEAYGYEFLKEQGYLDIKFIPIPSSKGKTPDLCAELDGRKIALLEVKTIRPSLVEKEYDNKIFHKIRSGTLSSEDIRCIDHNSDQVLPEGFKSKLKDRIERARIQLESVAHNDNPRKVAYLLIEVDRVLISGTPNDEKIADKIHLHLSKLAKELSLEVEYRFIGAFGSFLQQFRRM